MHKTKYTTFLLIVFASACGPQLEIPLKVSKNFWTKYENAKETEWSLSEGIYTVSYTVNGFPKEADFKTNGEWIRTVSYLPPRRSMVCIRDFLDENYPWAIITQLVFLETPEKEQYLVSIESIEDEYDDPEEGLDEENTKDTVNTGSSNEPTYLTLVFDSECMFVRENKGQVEQRLGLKSV